MFFLFHGKCFFLRSTDGSERTNFTTRVGSNPGNIEWRASAGNPIIWLSMMPSRVNFITAANAALADNNV